MIRDITRQMVLGMVRFFFVMLVIFGLFAVVAGPGMMWSHTDNWLWGLLYLPHLCGLMFGIGQGKWFQ